MDQQNDLAKVALGLRRTAYCGDEVSMNPDSILEIKPFIGIDDVRFGMSPGEVTQRWGLLLGQVKTSWGNSWSIEAL